MKKYCVILSLILIASCNSKKKNSIAMDDKDVYYTCSMHPQVVQDEPGKCPICHMDLIAVSKSGKSEDEIVLSDQQMQLGNIQTDTIRHGVIGDKVVLTATLNFDEMNVNTVSARVGGRIDRLNFKNLGDYVTKGAYLYEIYSEDLNNAKQEYIATLERQATLDNSIVDFKKLLESARNKLLLWGMNEKQIDELGKTKDASPATSFYSPVSGYVTELPVKEGQYVMEGSPVIKLADLSTLWAEGQIYASQLSTVDLNGNAIVQLPDIAGKTLTGRISFVNPEISSDTRINLIRVSIENHDNKLKPGMPAYILLKSDSKKNMTLPADAVLRDGTMSVVWVQSGKNTFKSKMVETGMENSGQIEIVSGLKNGDVVVVSGAYLLNSEYIFKKGSNPMAGHDMSDMKM